MIRPVLTFFLNLLIKLIHKLFFITIIVINNWLLIRFLFFINNCARSVLGFLSNR